MRTKIVLYAHAALFIVNALYGASHVIAKGVMPQFLTPSVFIFLRVIVATFLFFILYFVIKKEKIDKKDWKLFVACGFFGVAANQLFFFNGLNLSSAINSGIIMTLNPIFVLILSYFILKEKISFTKGFGIILAFISALMLILTDQKQTKLSVVGDLFLLINAFSYAVYLIISKPLMKKYSPLTVITFVFFFGSIFVLIYPPTLSEISQTNFAAIPIEIWWKIIYVVLGITFLAYLLTMFGLKHLSASSTSVYIYFQPIFVIFFAFVFEKLNIAEDHSSSISVQKIFFMLLIFIGIWLTNKQDFLKKSTFVKK